MQVKRMCCVLQLQVHNGKVQLLVDSRRSYPSHKKTHARGSKMNLSTGSAIVRPLVDRWMTYEEYERFTRCLLLIT